MARFFRFLIVSRRHKRIRGGVITALLRFLVAAGVVFTLEVALILLGMSGQFLPLTHAAKGILQTLAF